jgi:hypothetical protein
MFYYICYRTGWSSGNTVGFYLGEALLGFRQGERLSSLRFVIVFFSPSRQLSIRARKNSKPFPVHCLLIILPQECAQFKYWQPCKIAHKNLHMLFNKKTVSIFIQWHFTALKIVHSIRKGERLATVILCRSSNIIWMLLREWRRRLPVR